jgi:hypothetical protein
MNKHVIITLLLKETSNIVFRFKKFFELMVPGNEGKQQARQQTTTTKKPI